MADFRANSFATTSAVETPTPPRGKWSFVPVDIPALDHSPTRHMELLLPGSGESTRALYLIRCIRTNLYGGVREGPHGREVCCPLRPLPEIFVKGGIYHEGEIPLALTCWHKAIRIMSHEEFMEYLRGMMPDPEDGAQGTGNRPRDYGRR